MTLRDRGIARSWLITSLSLLSISFQAAAEIPVSGRITADGQPVAKARVALVPDVESYESGRLRLQASRPEPAAETKSDAGGLFDLSAPEIGLYTVRVEKEGFAPRELSLRPLVDGVELPELELEAARSLEVSVAGPDGTPLPARVRAERKEPDVGDDPFRRMQRFLTMDRGPWRAVSPLGRVSPEQALEILLPIPDEETPTEAATWVVEAQVEGWPPIRRDVGPGDEGKLRLQVEAGAEHQVQALDSEGRPVARVLLFLEDGILPLSETDAEGRAAVFVREGTQLHLRDPRGGFAELDLASQGPDGGSGEAEDGVRRVTLDDPITVQGRVVSEAGQEPVAGALVWSGSTDTGRSAADGTYSLTGPAGEIRDVSAAAAGYAAGRSRVVTRESETRGPTVTLTPAATLAGVVVDGDDQPVAAVEIGVDPQPLRRRGFGMPSPASFAQRSARTSERGRFQIQGLPLASGYQLRFTKDGLAPVDLEIENLESFEDRTSLRIVMGPGRRGVGRVVDERDEPVAGAEVRLETASANPRDRRRFFSLPGREEEEPDAVTDTEGRFEIPDLAAGRYNLQAEAFGFAAAKVPGLEVPEGTGEFDLGTLVLSPGALIEGRVLDGDSLPIAGAEVRVSEQSRIPIAFIQRRLAGQPPAATSGADGSFTVKDQRPGVRVDLVVQKEGYVPSSAAGVEAPTATPVQIVLRPTSRVLGRVLDGDGRPIAGAMVQTRPERQGGTGRRVGFLSQRAGTSDDDGTFEITDVEPGRVTVSAQAEGFRRRELSGLEVPDGEPLRGVEIRLIPGAEVRGNVTEADGTPVEGAMVSVTEPSSTDFMSEAAGVTDSEGFYQISGIGLGPRTVRARDRRSRQTATSVDIGEGSNVVDLVFDAGVEVSGHVVDKLGAPVDDATVRLSVTTGPSPAMIRGLRLETTSGADGSFVIGGVEPGLYSASASREGFADASGGEPFEVGDTPLSGLVLELDRGATVKGRVLGLEYDDLVRVRVRAARAYTEPDFEGRYELPNLPAGDHVVRAEIPGSGRQVQESVTIPEGVPEVVLDLEFGSGFTLTGVVMHGDRPVAGATLFAAGLGVNHQGSTIVSQDGGFRLEGLPEGRYRLSVSSLETGLSHTEEIEVTGDDDLRIEILTAQVAGLVRDAFDFEPIEGASLSAEAVDDATGASRYGRPSARSDARGYFNLGEISEGSWKVSVTKAGYGPVEEVVEVRAGRNVDDLELAMTATDGLYFEVRMASGRAPASVVLALLDGAGQRVTGGTFETTDGGKVRVTTAPAGSWQMLLQAEDGALLSLPVTAPGQLGGLVVPRSGSLRVTVPDLQNDAVGARMTLSGPSGLHRTLAWNGAIYDEHTLRNGMASASNLAAGLWTVQVTADDGRGWSGQASVSEGLVTELVLP